MAAQIDVGVRTLAATVAPAPVDSGRAFVTPSFVRRPGNEAVPAPVIDWSAALEPGVQAAAQAAPNRGWVGDFINHLARSEAQRNPNLGLRVHADVTPKAERDPGLLDRD